MNYKLIYKFFEGQTSMEEEMALREWINETPDNERLFLEERNIYDAFILNSENKTKAESYPERRIISSNKNKHYLKEFLKIAAVFLVTALGTWYYFSESKISDAMQTISVPAGQRLNLILPDGTNIWLNAKTTIKYPITFNNDKRLIYLDGQAYFDVAKNEDVPFIVDTKIGQVRALGTKFDVLAYSDDTIFETTLMEGKVKVNLQHNPQQSVILSPRDKSTLENGELKVSIIEDFSKYEWRNGFISFRDETFENIMKSFEKIYDVKIVIQNTKVNKFTFTGKFRVTDGVDYALRVLQRDVKFSYERDNEKHIIYINQ